MFISRTALMFVTFLLFIAVFVAKVSNLINVEVTDKDHDDIYKYNVPVVQNQTLSDKLKHIIWFVQISDIHISLFQDHTRITELREFCDTTIDTLRPSVVIASGDLTDAKTKDHIGSRQHEREWVYYHNVLDECRVVQKTHWLDVRGNHDNFNVPTLRSKENYFLNYSMQGPKHLRSYSFQTKNKDGDIYTFIGVDACLDPGPRRPFNFVGLLSENEIGQLTKMADEAVRNGSKHIIWFGHFPTSCILTAGNKPVRSVFGEHPESYAYLCGHLHQLGGLVPNMYTLQQSGYLELELGDWKENRMFRLAAIDHGLFSFVDVRHRSWPVVLVTNPKHAKYAIPNREPTHLTHTSSHIRMLVFSTADITTVRAQIDERTWINCSHSDGPLYTCKWNPGEYLHDLHTLRVYVKDGLKREKIISQPFSLDNTRMSFGLLARIALMTNISSVFQLLFGLLLIICIIPLCGLRCIHFLVKRGKITKPRIRNQFIRHWLQNLWMLSTIDRLFFPLALYPIYLTIGPWAFGYIVEDNLGIIFAWGIFIRGAYLPGSFTYAYGFLQMLIFQFPLVLIIAKCVKYRVHQITENVPKRKSLIGNFLFHFPFLFVTFIQIVLAYCFWLAYDTLAFLLSPLRTWSIIYAFYLWIQALALPEKCTREALLVWAKKNDGRSEESEHEAVM